MSPAPAARDSFLIARDDATCQPDRWHGLHVGGKQRVGGFGPACAAMEAFSRNLASELGPFGVRVVTIRSGGSPDSRIFQEAMSPRPPP